MKCMEYSNKNHINIIPQEDFEDLVQEVFDVIATNITKSLGPLGSSATIFDGTIVEATKDGYHILDKYIFNNRYKKMIYNLIKTPCTKMNNTVGDGTTTAIALTNELYQLYKYKEKDLKSLYRLPRQFSAAWDHVINMIISKVNKMATYVDPEDYDTIYNLAYISSNGNDDIAATVAKTYKEAKSPSIKMKDSPTNKSYIEAVEGFEFPTNAIDIVYVKNQDLTAKEYDVATMIFDHKIISDEFNNIIIPINNVMRAKGHKLVIIAPEYDAFMLDNVVKSHVNRELQQYRAINLILTQYKTSSLNNYQREDLAVILKSVVINQNISDIITSKIASSNVDSVVALMEDKTSEVYRCVGSAESVLLSVSNGSIFNVSDIENDEVYKSTLEWAEKDLQDILDHIDYEKKSYSSKVYDAKSRINQLKMKNYIYYIGADSELQKQILYDAVDDVIKCLRSAIKNGIVPGCQLSIIKACKDIIKQYRTDDILTELEFEIIRLIKRACMEVYSKVLRGPEKNGLDHVLKSGEFTTAAEILNTSVKDDKVFDLETETFNDKIVTSVETDTMVLRAASELIKILTSGNQCIFLDSEVNSSHQDDVEMYV